MILVDKLSYSSNLRYTSPYLKTFLSLFCLILCVSVNSIFLSLIIFILMGVLTVCVGKTKLSYYLHLLKLPIFFLLLSVISIIINFSKSIPEGYYIKILSFYLSIQQDSFLFASRLVIVAISSVSCLYFLSLSTPMTDLIHVMKKVHIPDLFIELMFLIYRFIFVLLDIASALTISQKSRLGNKSFKTSCTSLGNLMAVLLVRSFQRSSRLYDAMESRCYDGSLLVLEDSKSASTIQKTLLLLTVSILLLMSFLIKKVFLLP